MLLLLCGGSVFAADMVVLESGKTMRIDSYYVEGDKVQMQLNEHAQMALPLAWIKEIRSLPGEKVEEPPVPEPVAIVSTSVPYSNIVVPVSQKHNVDWKLVAAVMRIESNCNSRALSPKGALGLMQLMPATAGQYAINDPYDPQQNIEGGVRHLKMLLDRYSGKLELALAAYNSGQSAVDRYHGIPPFDETRDYVKKVLKLYQGLS